MVSHVHREVVRDLEHVRRQLVTQREVLGAGTDVDAGDARVGYVDGWETVTGNVTSIADGRVSNDQLVRLVVVDHGVQLQHRAVRGAVEGVHAVAKQHVGTRRVIDIVGCTHKVVT